jgi:hypothetical protein
VQGTPFHVPGNHVLTVLAANGYERSLAFTILPSVAGVDDGGSYVGDVVLAINGVAALDGVAVAAETTVTAPGNHELVLYLDGEPYRIVVFTITAPAEEPRWWETFPFAEVGVGMLAVTGLFLIFRKK